LLLPLDVLNLGVNTSISPTLCYHALPLLLKIRAAAPAVAVSTDAAALTVARVARAPRLCTVLNLLMMLHLLLPPAGERHRGGGPPLIE